MNTLGKRLMYARKLRGWSQNRLNKEAKLSVGVASRLESDKRGPSSDTLASVARVLRVRADWLLTGSGPMEAEAEGAPDLVPNRALAAKLARDDGVYEAAIVAVLAEKPDTRALSRSVLWWTDRMRMRQAEALGALREGGGSDEGSGVRRGGSEKKTS